MRSEPISSMSELLSSMEPKLDPDEFVYCVVRADYRDDWRLTLRAAFAKARATL